MDSKFTYSEFQKRDVHTWYVHDPKFKKRGMLTSITDALAKADPYDRIELLGGSFFESFLINKPVELVGGAGDEPLITSRGPVIQIACTESVVLSRIRVEARGKKEQEAVGVHVVNGTPLLQNMSMSSMVVSGTAAPIVESCSIAHSSALAGVFIGECGGGTFRQCEISEHAGPCFQLFTSNTRTLVEDCILYHAQQGEEHVMVIRGEIEIKNCRISGEGSPLEGVDAPLMQSADRLDETTVRNNNRPAREREKVSINMNFDLFKGGVLVDKGGNAFITGTEFTNTDVGMIVRESGRVVMSECEIQGAGYVGLLLVDDISSCQLNQCTIERSGGFGVVAQGNRRAAAELVSCAVTFSRNMGILLQGGSVDVKDSMVSYSTVRGAYCTGKCSALFTRTDFVKNHETHVLVKSRDAYAVLDECVFHTETKVGVQLDTCSPRVRVIGSTFEHNETSLVLTGSAGNPLVEKNKFNLCTHAHVSGTYGARGVIRGNFFEGNQGVHILLSLGANLAVEDNTINSHYTMTGIRCTDGSLGTLVNNTILRTHIGIEVSRWADPVASGNDVSDCREACVLVHDGGCGTFVKNKVSSGSDTCVLVKSGGEPTFRANEIREGASIGVRCAAGAGGHFEKNTFAYNSRSDVLLEDRDTTTVFTRNTFRGGGDYGFELSAGCRCQIYRNNVQGHRTAGVRCGGQSSCSVRHNIIRTQQRYGVMCMADAVDTFEKNRICGCEGAGLALCDGAHVTVLGDHISENGGVGVVVEQGSAGQLEGLQIQSNAKTGVNIVGKSTTTFRKCVITENGLDGVCVENGGAVFTESTISNNQGNGVVLKNCTPFDLLRSKVTGHSVNIVVARPGASNITHCIISHAKVANVVIEDHGGAVLSENTIEHSEMYGLWCRTNGQGTVRANVISECRISGICIESGSNPTFEKNVIRSCSSAGLHIQKNGKGLFQSNACEATRIVVEAGCAPHIEDIIVSDVSDAFDSAVHWLGGGSLKRTTIRNNNAEFGLLIESKIHHPPAQFSELSILGNRNCGVSFRGSAADVTLKDSAIDYNVRHGVVMEQSAQSTLSRCTVTGNSFFGILITTNAQGCVINTTVEKSGKANIVLEEGCQPLLDGNTLRNCDETALVIHGGGGEIVNTTFERNNRGVLVDLTNKGTPRVRFCLFRDNEHGIVATTSTLEMEHVDFIGNTNGVCAMVGSRMTLNSGCNFTENVTGMVLSNGATIGLSAATFEGNGAGIRVEGDVKGQVLNNSFRRNRYYGIHAFGGDNISSQLKVAQNLFTANGTAGVFVENLHTRFRLQSNTFEDETGAGVFQQADSQLVVLSNVFTHCVIGARVGDHTTTRIADNTFTANVCGVLGSGGSQNDESTVSGNSFIDHTDCAVRLEKLCSLTVSQNQFRRNCGRGAVLACRDARGLVTNNVFLENDVGVLAREDASTRVENNHFLAQGKYGMVIEDGAVCNIEGNVLGDSGKADCLVTTSAEPILSRNVFHTSKRANLEFIDNGGGHVFSNKFIWTVSTEPLSRNNSTNNVSSAAGSPSPTTANLMLHEDDDADNQPSASPSPPHDPALPQHAPRSGITLTHVVAQQRSKSIFATAVSKDKVCAVRIASSSYPTIERNFFDGPKIAFWATDTAGRAKVMLNHVLGCTHAGFWIDSDADVSFFKNVVYGAKGACVVLDVDGRGEVHHNRLAASLERGRYGIHNKGINNTTAVFGNIISHGLVGVHWEAQVGNCIRDNYISNCRTGVSLMPGSVGTLEKNEICENDIGIMVHPDSTTNVMSNRVYSNKRVGALLSSDKIQISDNLIAAEDDSAVEVRAGAAHPHKTNRIRHKFIPDVRRVPDDVPDYQADFSSKTTVVNVDALLRTAREVVQASSVLDEGVFQIIADSGLGGAKKRSGISLQDLSKPLARNNSTTSIKGSVDAEADVADISDGAAALASKTPKAPQQTQRTLQTRVQSFMRRRTLGAGNEKTVTISPSSTARRQSFTKVAAMLMSHLDSAATAKVEKDKERPTANTSKSKKSKQSTRRTSNDSNKETTARRRKGSVSTALHQAHFRRRATQPSPSTSASPRLSRNLPSSRKSSSNSLVSSRTSSFHKKSSTGSLFSSFGKKSSASSLTTSHGGDASSQNRHDRAAAAAKEGEDVLSDREGSWHESLTKLRSDALKGEREDDVDATLTSSLREATTTVFDDDRASSVVSSSWREPETTVVMIPDEDVTLATSPERPLLPAIAPQPRDVVSSPTKRSVASVSAPASASSARVIHSAKGHRTMDPGKPDLVVGSNTTTTAAASTKSPREHYQTQLQNVVKNKIKPAARFALTFSLNNNEGKTGAVPYLKIAGYHTANNETGTLQWHALGSRPPPTSPPKRGASSSAEEPPPCTVEGRTRSAVVNPLRKFSLSGGSKRSNPFTEGPDVRLAPNVEQLLAGQRHDLVKRTKSPVPPTPRTIEVVLGSAVDAGDAFVTPVPAPPPPPKTAPPTGNRRRSTLVLQQKQQQQEPVISSSGGVVIENFDAVVDHVVANKHVRVRRESKSHHVITSSAPELTATKLSAQLEGTETPASHLRDASGPAKRAAPKESSNNNPASPRRRGAGGGSGLGGRRLYTIDILNLEETTPFTRPLVREQVLQDVHTTTMKKRVASYGIESLW